MVKVTRLIPVAFLLANMIGCASSGSNPGKLTASTIPDNCNQQLASNAGGAGPYDPSLASVLLGTVGWLGTNWIAYGTCEMSGRLTPAPASSVEHGVYHSEDGRVSVALPDSLALQGKSGIEIWEAKWSNNDKVYFISVDPSGPVYGIDVLHWALSGAAPTSLDQFDERLFNSRFYSDENIVTGAKLDHLHRENVVLADGKPAILEILRSSAGAASNPASARPYLIFYLLKVQDSYSVLSIAWRGACPKCDSGPESEIRNMDPGIARFVNSFELQAK